MYCTIVPCWRCSIWLWKTGRCTQHNTQLLPWAPSSAWPDQCSFLPCWEAEVLPHHRDTCTASGLRENVGICMHCDKHCGKPEFIQEQACCSLDFLVVWLSERTFHLAQVSYRRQHIVSYVAGRMVRLLSRSSDWDILAAWCDALALKPGWGWDGWEPSQVQKCLPGREIRDVANA